MAHIENAFTVSVDGVGRKILRVILFMDCEPDDLALLLHAENNVDIHVQRVITTPDSDGWARVSKVHEMMKILGASYRLDIETGTGEAIRQALIDFPDATLIATATFAPLLALYNEDDFVKREESRALFKRTKLIAYGSVNVRWTYFGKLEGEPLAVFKAMLNQGFARATFYETFFALGDSNSLNPDTAPNLCYGLESTIWPESIIRLRQEIHEWNNHLLLEQVAKVQKSIPEFADLAVPFTDDQVQRMTAYIDAKKERFTNVKVVLSIGKYFGKIQMVAADVFVLPIVLCEQYSAYLKPVTIEFETKTFITHAPPTETSTAHYFIVPKEDQAGMMARLAENAMWQFGRCSAWGKLGYAASPKRSLKVMEDVDG